MKNHTRLGLIVAAGLAAITVAAIPASAAEVTSTPNSAVTNSNLQWVRGTTITLVNQTNEPVQVGTQANAGDIMPDPTTHALALGAQESSRDDWTMGACTGVFTKAKFADGTLVRFQVSNPSIGNPVVKVQDPKDTSRVWPYAKFSKHNFDEGESWAVGFDNGRSISFTRQSDASGGHSDAKVWLIQIQ